MPPNAMPLDLMCMPAHAFATDSGLQKRFPESGVLHNIISPVLLGGFHLLFLSLLFLSCRHWQAVCGDLQQRHGRRLWG